MGRVYALKNVRLFYKKTDRMKFISHLDMNRFMARLITKSKIPVWYTEGFNQRIYTNFAIPLSLGYEGTYEVMDIRIIDDDFSYSRILESLNNVCTDGIEFFKAQEPILQMKDISYAGYELEFETENMSFYDKLSEFLSRKSVICQKTTKRGNLKEFDLMPKIISSEIKGRKLVMVLKAGNEDNVNPSLVLNTFFEKSGIDAQYYTVKRTMIYDADMKEFE